MKLLFFFLTLYFCNLIGVAAQETSTSSFFILNGKVLGQENGKIILKNLNTNKSDTCLLQNGKFYFTGEITEPTRVALRGAVKSNSDTDLNAVIFYIEPTIIDVELKYNEFKNLKISGVKTQLEYELLNDKIKKLEDKGSDLFVKMEKIYKQFIISNPESFVSCYALRLYSKGWPIDTVSFLYNKLSNGVRNSFIGIKIIETINRRINNMSGKPAKGFLSIDLKNKIINLSDFTGKYVLLDFWASWCKPCRENTPALIEIFKKYHNSGLEIISIADDFSPNDWKKAIFQDGTQIWHHVLNDIKKDMNGNLNRSMSIADKYAINLLPTLVLIDKNGIILSYYEGVEQVRDLSLKLNEIFQR
ncbi:TlpA disulfide reductase family protein [Pedobacter frigiditerrae]|uniref:TlpA disulfide reductase family protein n=1 Tax=Pedobacter frigiditerrae TaxID=2530452 RepID=UPI00292DB64A|nr:TlpA disulfide reductase family protein [Pedobacter frigiditerrae]